MHRAYCAHIFKSRIHLRGRSNREAFLQEIRFCTAPDGVRLAYSTMGDGPPLVKTANWLSHLEFDLESPVWRHWFLELSRDFRLIRYDDRGCGLSDWDVEDLSLDALVADLETVVEAVGVERFDLMGLSRGGTGAIAYAARHPERVSRLVLYGTFAQGWAVRDPSPEEMAERQALVTLTRQGWGRDNPAYRQLFTQQFVPGATEEQIRSFNELQRVSASPENAALLQMASGQIDVSGYLRQVKAPTLILHARHDARVPFEAGRRIAAEIPNGRFVPLESQNHILLEHEEAWSRFLKEVRDFLGVSGGARHVEADGVSIPETHRDERRAAEVEPAGSATSSVLRQLKETLPSQYEVERELARGGMGTVFLARDSVLDRRVAIKVHRAETAGPTTARRMQQEARILARLKHPNVVSVYHAGQLGDSFYYIMDYVDGATLQERLAQGPLSRDAVLAVGDDVLSALGVAHANGVIHRDIKPSNIFLLGDRALLGDFGIAKHSDSEMTSITESGHRVGTPGYMAPEQVAGGEVTPETDIYAFSMVLYEAFSGRRWSLLTSPEDADWSGVPREHVATLSRGLAWSPGERWPDAGAFREALANPRRPRGRWGWLRPLFSRSPGRILD